MKKMRLCLLVFLIGILISACAQGAATGVGPTFTPPVPAAGALQTTVPQAAQPAARATSRGDKLEASDPSSVKISDGRPVLVEFFRFT